MVLRAATVPCRSPALQVISYRTNSIRVPDLTQRKSTTFLYTTKKRAGNSPPFLILQCRDYNFPMLFTVPVQHPVPLPPKVR